MNRTLFALALFVLAAMPAAVLAAPCAPGLPCVTPKTANDPMDPKDGPSVSGAPNADKLGDAAGAGGELPTCDADFMNQIYAKAFLEANRENVMNQVLIRRPDSVLEYSCFDQLLAHSGGIAGTLFSESTAWRPSLVPIGGFIGPVAVPAVAINVYMGAGHLNNNLSALVRDSLNKYLTKNFAHTFLGRDKGPDFVAGGAFYTCGYMNSVYFMSKCTDMHEDDPFLDFRTLVKIDPRLMPESCMATGIKDDVIDVAENKGFSYVNFDTMPSGVNLLEPPPVACGAPVPTGMTATRRGKTLDFLNNITGDMDKEFPDKFCINPSCHYDESANKCVP